MPGRALIKRGNKRCDGGGSVTMTATPQPKPSNQQKQRRRRRLIFATNQHEAKQPQYQQCRAHIDPLAVASLINKVYIAYTQHAHIHKPRTRNSTLQSAMPESREQHPRSRANIFSHDLAPSAFPKPTHSRTHCWCEPEAARIFTRA